MSMGAAPMGSMGFANERKKTMAEIIIGIDESWVCMTEDSQRGKCRHVTEEKIEQRIRVIERVLSKRCVCGRQSQWEEHYERVTI